MRDRVTGSFLTIHMRLFLTWLAANFLLVGTASWWAGGWYLGWETSPAVRMLVELGMILPNLILPVAVLRSWWPEPIHNLRQAMGWVWNGWRSIIVGLGAFLLAIGWMAAVETLIGESMPCC
jgi:hypothetical protein